MYIVEVEILNIQSVKLKQSSLSTSGLVHKRRENGAARFSLARRRQSCGRSFSIYYQSVPTLTFGQEFRAATERISLRIHAAEISFLELEVEPLLLRVERSQLRLFRHQFYGHGQLEGDPGAEPELAGEEP